MIYRDFGKTGWKVSAMGMGTWNIGNQWGEIDDVTAFATIRSAYDNGVNMFDTAEAYGNPYGLSEERLGVGLTGIRHKAYIIGKIGHWGKRTGQGVPNTTPDMVRLSAHACLHRLRTDYIDVMLCHEKDIMDPDIYLEAFEILKKSGEILQYGISTDDIEVLKRFNQDGNCAVVEVEYSLLNRSAEDSIFPYCKKHGIAVVIRGPLGQGLLSGKYSKNTVFSDSVRLHWNEGGVWRERFLENVEKTEKLKSLVNKDTDMAAAALRFVISHPINPIAIPGAKTPEQARKNAADGEKLFTVEDLEMFSEEL